MSARGGKIVIASVAVVASWFFGVNFWKPLVIEQLHKDGNLRDDVAYVKTADEMDSWADLRNKWKAFVDPQHNFSEADKQSLEKLKEHLQENKPTEKTDK